MTAQEAYAEDVRRQPFYHDGEPRKSWHELANWAQWSWERNPTPRTYRQPVSA